MTKRDATAGAPSRRWRGPRRVSRRPTLTFGRLHAYVDMNRRRRAAGRRVFRALDLVAIGDAGRGDGDLLDVEVRRGARSSDRPLITGPTARAIASRHRRAGSAAEKIFRGGRGGVPAPRSARSGDAVAADQVAHSRNTPFYTRKLLSGADREATCPTICESVDLDRFASPWVQTLLPFKMPPLAEEPSVRLIRGLATRLFGALPVVAAQIAKFADSEKERQAKDQPEFEQDDDTRAHLPRRCRGARSGPAIRASASRGPVRSTIPASGSLTLVRGETSDAALIRKLASASGARVDGCLRRQATGRRTTEQGELPGCAATKRPVSATGSSPFSATMRPISR